MPLLWLEAWERRQCVDAKVLLSMKRLGLSQLGNILFMKVRLYLLMEVPALSI